MGSVVGWQEKQVGVGLEIRKAHVGPKENRWALRHAWDWAKMGNGSRAQSKIKRMNMTIKITIQVKMK